MQALGRYRTSNDPFDYTDFTERYKRNTGHAHTLSHRADRCGTESLAEVFILVSVWTTKLTPSISFNTNMAIQEFSFHILIIMKYKYKSVGASYATFAGPAHLFVAQLF